MIIVLFSFSFAPVDVPSRTTRSQQSETPSRKLSAIFTNSRETMLQVVEDMTEECSKYGTVAAIEIPHVGGAGAGVGFVFVKYHTREDAQKVGCRVLCLGVDGDWQSPSRFVRFEHRQRESLSKTLVPSRCVIFVSVVGCLQFSPIYYSHAVFTSQHKRRPRDSMGAISIARLVSRQRMDGAVANPAAQPLMERD